MTSLQERRRTNMATWRSKPGNPELNRAQVAQWRSTKRARAMLTDARRRAKAKGLECTITAEEIDSLLEPMTCAVSRRHLSWDGGPWDWWKPSPDRIDNGVGYVTGNVRIVASVVNRMKGRMDEVDFQALILDMAEMYNARA